MSIHSMSMADIMYGTGIVVLLYLNKRNMKYAFDILLSLCPGRLHKADVTPGVNVAFCQCWS